MLFASLLPTLLSQALVAFTIEFDNEAEHRMPHRTTRHSDTPGAQSGPWLVSMAMWLNCMRFVPDEGITFWELVRLARTETNLPGMLRWGYLSLEPNPGAPTCHARAFCRPFRWCCTAAATPTALARRS